MDLGYISFTDRGKTLAEKIAAELGGEVWKSGEPYRLREWTEKAFKKYDGLVFVGACGIAVRAIAPYVKSKVEDPAVVVIDECGKFAIPVLSGHIGGANDLAREIARVSGAEPVVTTATDRNDVFAVDEWAKHQDAVVIEPHKIMKISSAVLKGDDVSVKAGWDISGSMPDHVRMAEDDETPDIELDVQKHFDEPIHIAPVICSLGIGCRKGTAVENIEKCFNAFCEKFNVIKRSVKRAATIDLKKDEKGLLDFCSAHDFPLDIYTAEELQEVKGDFTGSDFVKKITGVDNVCERSALRSAGEGGSMIVRKFALDGVTMALAVSDYHPDWSWKYE
jgi:cobalt-precorrin 5A hydrolase